MLVREADAWRALMQLHGCVMQNARVVLQHHQQFLNTAAIVHPEDERVEASEQRDASYCASMTNLAAQCDSLAAEAIRIRNLRRAQRQMHLTACREITRAHSDEALALGDTLGRNGATQIGALTSDVRATGQRMRAQIAQTRTLLQAISDARALHLPAHTEIVVGLRHMLSAGRDGQSNQASSSSPSLSSSTRQNALPSIFSVEEFLTAVYSLGEGLTDEAIALVLCNRQSEHRSVAGTGSRVFARRGHASSNTARPPQTVTTVAPAPTTEAINAPSDGGTNSSPSADTFGASGGDTGPGCKDTERDAKSGGCQGDAQSRRENLA